MAQSNNGDIFDFLINPVFSTEGVKDSYNTLSDELGRIAERIADQIEDKLGDAFTKGIDKTNINQVIKLVNSLGGEVTRTGTTINTTFKDASGNIIKVADNVKSAISLIENDLVDLRNKGVDIGDSLTKIQEFKTTGQTYTFSDQIKEQNELENNIIQNLEKRYQYELKIKDAQRDGDSAKKSYYETLKSILKTERDEYSTQLKNLTDSDTTAEIQKQEAALHQKANAYGVLTSEQKKQETQDATEKKNIQDATTLLKQYYTIRSNMDKMKANGQEGGNYWSEQEQELQKVIASLTTYGVTVDQTTGKLKFDQQAQQALQLASNIDKVNTTVNQGNAGIEQRNAKLADQAPIIAIKNYEQELRKARELESNNKQGTQAYQQTQQAIAALETELDKYGIKVNTSADGTHTLEVKQGAATTQTQQLTEAINNFNVSQENANAQNDSFGKSIQESVANFIKYQVALEALNKLVSEFTSAIKEMDDAMTQVRMVTMDSYEDTVKLSQQYGELAQKLGTTVTTVAEGADAWLRQGYNAKDAMTMLEASTTLATVGQMSAADATDQLTAVTKSYNTEVEDTMGIVDKLVSVDLAYAASSSEISTALQKVASSAGQAGLGLDKLIGLITVSEEKTRQSAEVIGSAWQSIVSRISKIPANVDLDDLTDETGKVVATVNDADKVLTKYGIALVGTDGKMRDLGTIMDEIGAKWSKMSQLEQNQLAYVVAGLSQCWHKMCLIDGKLL